MNIKKVLVAVGCLLVVGLGGKFLSSTDSAPKHERDTVKASTKVQSKSVFPKPSVVTTDQSAARVHLTGEQLAEKGKQFYLAAPQPEKDVPAEHQILLRSRAIVVQEGSTLTSLKENRLTQRGTFPLLVQLLGVANRAAREQIANCGGRVIGVVPNRAVLVECSLAACGKISRLKNVRGVMEFAAEDKLSPFLADASRRFDGETKVRILPLAKEDLPAIADKVITLGGEVHSQRSVVVASVALVSIPELAHEGAVRWIEQWVQPTISSDRALGKEYLAARRVWDVGGLDGSGIKIAHSDVGIDTGNPGTVHPDLRERIKKIIPLVKESDGSDPVGHGTHTAGSIVGDGTASGGKYKGSAPGADLYAYTFVAKVGGAIIGIPDDLGELFILGYQEGARIHSGSWGASNYVGDYTYWDERLDNFVWRHPDFLPVIAAGNEGLDYDKNGAIDPCSMNNPALSKNCLSVGAAESGRPPNSGGYTSDRYGDKWPQNFPVEPIKSDYVSSSTNGLRGMAAFSSRGPAGDGRIKPDVVAPGTDIISTKSSVGGSGWGIVPNTDNRYCLMGGTSMATPLVAGGVALMRQYAIERGEIPNPSAALMKAMMINGARTLYPGQYNPEHPEIPQKSPNNVEGWGHANFERSLYPELQNVFLYDDLDVPNAVTNRYQIQVIQSGRPLCVTLAWVDYPATEGAGKTLVNDYDLEIVSPDGEVFYPNDGTGPDRTNNVERILIPQAQEGSYEVRVTAAECGYGADEGGAVAFCLSGAVEKQMEIVHISHETLSVNEGDPFPIEFTVQTLEPLTNALDSALVHYTFGTETGPTGSESQVSARCLSNSVYRAEISSFPLGGTCYYWIEATSVTDGLKSVSITYHTYLNVPVELSVSGNPEAYGSPDPMYGESTLTSGTAAVLSAPDFVPVSENTRMRCQGYVGSGSVPFFGTTNSVIAKIEQDSSIIWVWLEQCALKQRMGYFFDGLDLALSSDDLPTTWHDKGTTAETVVVPDLKLAAHPHGSDGDRLMAFSGWVDDETGERYRSNPARDIQMDRPKQLAAEYREFWQDSNGDYISDWWTLLYFGENVTVDPYDDPDGDTYPNLMEFYDNTDPRDRNSFPTPPTIILHPIEPFQTQYPPWIVTAEITDNMNVEGALLLWREVGENDWHEARMWRTGNETDSLFAAYLDPPSKGGKRVEYCVHAFDLLGIATQYQFGTASESEFVEEMYDFPVVVVEPDQALDCRFHHRSTETNSQVRVKNLAGPDLVWTSYLSTASTVLGPRGWSGDGWLRTMNRSEDGSPVWYCGDTETHQYQPSTVARLNLGPIQLPADHWCVLSVRHWMQSEQADELYAADWGIAEISLDGGSSWYLLEPCGGWPMRIFGMQNPNFPLGVPCCGGTQSGWRDLYFVLGIGNGSSVPIRLTFCSDDKNQYEGWYIGEARLHTFEEALPSWMQYENANGGTLRERESAALDFHVSSAELSPHEPEKSLLGFFSEGSPRFQAVIPIQRRLGNLLTLSAGENGSISADKTFLCAPDNNPEIHVLADNYYQIDSVQGMGCTNFIWQTNVTNLDFTLNDVRTDTMVYASFTEQLAKHGVPQPWYASFGITSAFDREGEKDPDGDHLRTWEEYYADTCPTNQLSTLKILSLTNEELTWRGGTKRAQMIQHADSLTNAWETIQTIEPPTPQTNSYQVTPRGFYRISVEAPE